MSIRTRAIERFLSGERPSRILTRNNQKIMKGNGRGYMTTGIHLSPANMVSKKTLCPNASKGCIASCLNTSGQGSLHMLRKTGRYAGQNTVQESRALKTIWFEKDRKGFMERVDRELRLFKARAKREGMTPVCRLNLTSDFPFHRTGIMENHPEIIFYDYTANLYNDELPENYFLTFSKKEDNDIRVDKAIERGMNISVVFDELPETYKGLPVIDGDKDDLRFLDNSKHKQVVVGLKAKGQAKKDISGFVVYNNSKKSHILLDRIAA